MCPGEESTLALPRGGSVRRGWGGAGRRPGGAKEIRDCCFWLEGDVSVLPESGSVSVEAPPQVLPRPRSPGSEPQRYSRALGALRAHDEAELVDAALGEAVESLSRSPES